MSMVQLQLKMKALLVALCILAMSCSSTKAYPGGAPEQACDEMAPHHGAEAQTSHIPYEVSFSETSVEGGARVKTILRSSGAEMFERFLLKAVDSATENQTLGTFDVSDSRANAKTISCTLGTDNAVTHTNINVKTEVAFDWIAPSDFNGNVRFLFAVMQDINKTTFWVKGKSDDLAVSVTYTALPCPSDTSEQPTTTTPSTGCSCALQVSIMWILVNLAFVITNT